MKNKTLFVIVILVASLWSNSHLVAQSVEQDTDDRLEATGLNNQSSSPLMMFSDAETESPTDPTTDSRSPASRDVSPRGAATADSSSDAARGTASGLAEEGEDESSLTLDHFRSALAQNPTAARLVIVEDEENEGALSIQPRVAGTSKFALSKNKVENTTIIEALRELLVTRHEGSSEIVASFFDGDTKADAPLSAESLREILSRSDAALEKPSSSKKAPQKTPPASASENEATSPLDDSNMDEFLDAETQGSLLTTAKANVAIAVFEKTQDAVNSFHEIIRNVDVRDFDESASIADSVDSEWILNSMHVDYQNRLAQRLAAASLKTGFGLLPQPPKKLSSIERDIDGYKHLAEEKRSQALATSLAAKKIKTKAASGKGDLEQERSAYEAAEEAWNDIVFPYSTALDIATDATIDISELAPLLYAAQANELYWRANIVGIEVRQTERGITSRPNETQSSKLASAWAKTITAYEAALAKAITAGLKSSEWTTNLTNAQTQQATWAARTAQLKFDREEAEINDQEQTRRASFRRLQANARGAGIIATGAQKEASEAAETIEATHWNAASEEARKAEASWKEVVEVCQQSLSEAPARFQDSWKAELKKATDNKEIWISNIVSFQDQKKASIARVRAQEITRLRNLAAESYVKSNEAKAAGKIDEGISLHKAGMSFGNGAEMLGKAIEAEAAGRPAEAVQWREAATLNQQSVEFFSQAAMAYATEKIGEGQSWGFAGLGFFFAAEKLGKAIEAEAAEKPAEAAQWREAVGLYQQSVELLAQADRGKDSIKWAKKDSESNAGQGFFLVADKLGKAIEAAAAGKPAEAAK